MPCSSFYPLCLQRQAIDVSHLLLGRTAISAFFIAIATYISFYPFLLSHSTLIHGSKTSNACLCLLSFGLSYCSEHPVNSLETFPSSIHIFASNPIGITFSLTIPNGKPNLGLAWYMFIEMFDYLRPLFLFVWQCLIVLPIPAVCIKFSHRLPTVSLFLTVAAITIQKPYPNTSDYALYLDCLFLLGPVVKYYDQVYVFLATIFSWFICVPNAILAMAFLDASGEWECQFLFCYGYRLECHPRVMDPPYNMVCNDTPAGDGQSGNHRQGSSRLPTTNRAIKLTEGNADCL